MGYEFCCLVLHTLKYLQQFILLTKQRAVAVVQTTADEGVCQVAFMRKVQTYSISSVVAVRLDE